MSSLDTIGGNVRGDELAKALGFSSAEELKEDYVPRTDVSLWDIAYEKRSRKIFLVSKSRRGEPIETYLTLPSSF